MNVPEDARMDETAFGGARTVPGREGGGRQVLPQAFVLVLSYRIGTYQYN